MITYALEDMQVGDSVEMEEPPPPLPPPPPPPAPRGPAISCAAQNATARVGDSVNIRCQAASPDQRPLSVAFATDGGRVVGNGMNATLDTRTANPGPVTVTATATDDRNLSASATAGVTLEAPAAAPTASKLADVQFKPNGSYVDNRAKAVLDEIALRLQREADSKAVVAGFGKLATPAGARVAATRSANVKTYLTRDKGIDAQRISTRSAEGADAAEIWIVPAGAQPPQ